MARKLNQIVSALLTALAVSASGPSVLADTVTVDSKATGGFGLHPAAAPPAGGTPMVSGFVFDGRSTVTVIATGTIDTNPDPSFGLVDTSPDGTDFVGDDFGSTRADFGYLPLEEALVDGGADFTLFSNTLPDVGALIGAFVPKSTVDLPGFSPEDEDFGTPGIASNQLFFIGAGPFEFKAKEAGTLFLGINDSRAFNNTKSFDVTLSENVSIADDVTVGPDHTIGEGAVIGRGTTIGEDADIGEDVTIRRDVKVGNDVMIGENVIIGRDCVIGNMVEIGNNTTIGRDCLIGDVVTIGANVIIRKNVEVITGAVIPDDDVIPKDSIVFP
jgi:acetyltransferase-like isoleucine patch superfamily enzyme